MKIFLSVIFTIIGLCILGIIFIYSGIYDVTAAKPENGFMKWILSTTSDNAVAHYAKSITAPNLNDSAMIKAGFVHYKEMCQTCHGAPGQKQTDLAKGLNPHAPNLSRSGEEMSSAQLFWVTKNGIKMTGMPAWGKTHPDDSLWAIVAAVKKLHEVTPEEYNSLTQKMSKKEMVNPLEKSDSKEQKIRYH